MILITDHHVPHGTIRVYDFKKFIDFYSEN
jgi:hypothetical protein